MGKATPAGLCEMTGSKGKDGGERPAGGPRGEEELGRVTGGGGETPRANRKKEEKTGRGQIVFREEKVQDKRHLVCGFLGYHITNLTRLLEGGGVTMNSVSDLSWS